MTNTHSVLFIGASFDDLGAEVVRHHIVSKRYNCMTGKPRWQCTTAGALFCVSLGTYQYQCQSLTETFEQALQAYLRGTSGELLSVDAAEDFLGDYSTEDLLTNVFIGVRVRLDNHLSFTEHALIEARLKAKHLLESKFGYTTEPKMYVLNCADSY